MKQSAMLTDGPATRRGAFRLFALALTLLALALALPVGAAASPGADVADAPTIASFTPDEGPVGTLVVLMGSGFTGARRVTLGRAEAGFTVYSDDSIVLTVPAGALGGPISVTTPDGSAVSAGSFTVTLPPPVITVLSPTGTGSYAQGSSLTVIWTTSSAVYDGEFALGVRSPDGTWNPGNLVPASGAASYGAGLTLDVPPGSGYKVMVAWAPRGFFTRWSAYATSSGSFAVYAGNAKAITAFGFQTLTPPVTGVVDEAAHTIALTVTRPIDLHALVATFTTSGASVAVGGTPQVSGVTANDFSSPVTYKVTAFDGSTQDYTVTVTVIVPLAIGDAYGGGVVAYILQSRDPGYRATVQHGLIAATADQTSYEGRGVQWATKPYWDISVPGTSTAIGSGSANTTKIVAQNGAGSTYAAGLARAYSGGGYSDWYLPSTDELFKLYLNRAAIGGFVSAWGSDYYYWSSSELYAGHAWAQDFYHGNPCYNDKKGTNRVRAVRAF